MIYSVASPQAVSSGATVLDEWVHEQSGHGGGARDHRVPALQISIANIGLAAVTAECLIHQQQGPARCQMSLLYKNTNSLTLRTKYKYMTEKSAKDIEI